MDESSNILADCIIAIVQKKFGKYEQTDLVIEVVNVTSLNCASLMEASDKFADYFACVSRLFEVPFV